MAAGLIYQRNIPLIGLTALPVLALHIDAEWRTLRDVGGMRRVFARDSAGRRDGPWALGVALLLLALTVSASPLSSLGVVRAGLDPKVFPVAAVEKAREAGAEWPDLQRFHLGWVPAAQVAGAEGFHRRPDRLLRRRAHQDPWRHRRTGSGVAWSAGEVGRVPRDGTGATLAGP